MAAGTGVSNILVERKVRVRASPETVFGFLVDPQKLTRWMGTDATLDPRPGGVFHVNVNGHETVSGRYVEVEPHSRVTFTWGWDDNALGTAPGSTTVVIDLEPDGDHTVLNLTHHDLAPDMRAFHVAGWTHYLERLTRAAAGDDPGQDPHTTTLGTMRLGIKTLPPRYIARFPARRIRQRLRRS